MAQKQNMAREQEDLSHMTRACKTVEPSCFLLSLMDVSFLSFGFSGNLHPSHRLGAMYTLCQSMQVFAREIQLRCFFVVI